MSDIENSIVDWFIEEELDEQLLKIISSLVLEAKENREIAYRELNGNIFDVVFDFNKGIVQLTCIIQPDQDGEQHLPLEDFLSKIGNLK